MTEAKPRSAGFIFKKAWATKGVTKTCGYALHTADYVRSHWNRHFELVDIVEGGIEGTHSGGKESSAGASLPLTPP